MFSQISREKKMKHNKALIFLWLIMMSVAKRTTFTMGQKMYGNHLYDYAKSAPTLYNNSKNNNYDDDDNNNNNSTDIVNDNINNNDLMSIDLRTFNSKELDINKLIPNIWAYFNDHLITDIATINAPGSRTFGKIRRLQQVLLPLAFKFGVLFSMITFLLLLGLKTFFLLKVLILINVVAILSKFFTLKSSTDEQYSHILSSHGHYVGGGSVNTYIPHHLTDYPHMGKEVHLHIHGNIGGGGGGSGGGGGVSNGIHDNFITTSSHLSNIIPSYHSSPNGWKRNFQTSTQDNPKSFE